MAQTVTVIIPTTASPQRLGQLKEAIKSTQCNDARVRVLCVVNGDRSAPNALDEITNSGADYTISPVASAPLAQLAGRKAVETPYFCFLDDDDVYLPHAIDIRLEALQKQGVDVLVTNGFRSIDGRDMLALTSLVNIPADPLAALFLENWLASCGALFTAEGVPISYFEEPHPYLEWTWLAFRLANSRLKIGVLDKPTYRINDTTGSLSKSDVYLTSHVTLFRRMLGNRVPAKVRSTIKRRLASAYHSLSEHDLARKDVCNAWRNHGRSLQSVWGLGYLPYTRILVFASFRELGRGGRNLRSGK